jgi:hypothetical protein
MSINVTCPSCHTRLQVSEKFAGRTGPCPKCKKPIKIPKAEEQIKIHERAHEGAKDAKGKLILKPISRTEAKINPLLAGLFALWLIAGVTAAWFGSTTLDPHTAWLIGSAILAPPVVAVGYTFLRNDELEPYSGTAFAIRVAICSIAYMALWAGFYLVPEEFRAFGTETADMLTLGLVLAPFIIGGTFAALGSLDLDFANAFFHYAQFLVATIGLRALLGLPAL